MNAKIWAQFLERLKEQVNDRCLAYIENLSCRSMTDQTWNLCLPNRSMLNFVESNLDDTLRGVLHSVMCDAGMTDVSIVYSIENEQEPVSKRESGYLPFDPVTVTDISVPDVKKASFQVSRAMNSEDAAGNSDLMNVLPFVADIKVREASHLNANFTFDSFIKGGSNEMAYCAAKAVAANPAGAYNPLFIYGGVGIGKTHLMHAIGNEIIETSNIRVRYMTSEEFTNDYLDAVRNNRMQEFRESIRRNCDVLLLDDIQFIAGKAETQKEFFNTFNDLQRANKQIVLTSDKHPQEIKELEERIRSRFLGGLMADIQLPEYETRLEILRKKSRSENFYIPDDVAQYIASKVTSNVRELEGCIKRIKASADIHNEHISLSLAQKLIEPFYQTRTVLLDANKIIDCVCRYFGISNEEMVGKSRAKPFVYPRQIAMYLARSHTSLSFPDLGRVFGRDHTTVLHAVQRIMDDLAKKDTALQFDIKRLEDELFK